MAVRFTLAVAIAALVSGGALAEAGGPDFYRVTGVPVNDVLNLRDGPSPSARIIGTLPPKADGLRNLGCRGGLTFAEWEKASPAKREAERSGRWCKIEHDGKVGWANGRYLREGSAP